MKKTLLWIVMCAFSLGYAMPHSVSAEELEALDENELKLMIEKDAQSGEVRATTDDTFDSTTQRGCTPQKCSETKTQGCGSGFIEVAPTQ